MSGERRHVGENILRFGLASLIGITSMTPTHTSVESPGTGTPFERIASQLLIEPGIYKEVAPERPFFHNGFIGIKQTQFDTGILDLYRNTENGWELYNNIVPVAQVGPFLSNAELDGVEITPEIIEDEGEQVVKFQFSQMRNGAHFYLVASMEPKKREIEITPYLYDDSLPLHAFALGSYFGLQEQVNTIQIQQQLLSAQSFASPDDGAFMQGDFYSLPDTGTEVQFWGKRSNGRQYIHLLSEEDMHVEVEVRKTPWLPTQPLPDGEWFETVQVWQEGFSKKGKSLIFGYAQRSE